MEISELQLVVKPSLSPSELDDVDALVREARWNQIAADWRVFLAHGRVYTLVTADGRIVATTATLPYGGRFAWISMVLVAGEYRRRGLATQLMRRAMDELAAAGLIPALDATPDGRAVYRRLGFTDSWGFARLIRRERPVAAAPFAAPTGVTVRAMTDADWPALCAYDATAFGAERGAVLAGLRGRLPPAEFVAERAGRIAGFILGRDGMLAGHLCPLTADDDVIACALIARALDAIDGPLFIDFADDKTAVRSFLETRGFAGVRPFTRMLHGTPARFDAPARTFAVVGPEFG
jgi:GNAT superfamily N-acetyltransferase